VSTDSRYRGPEYRRLLAAARRSLERTGGDLAATVGIGRPDDAERKGIIGITGQYRPAAVNRITVRLADLDAAIRAATGRGLPELLTEIGGPLRNRPAEKSDYAVAREAITSPAERSSLSVTCGWYARWLEGIDRDGTITRLINQGEQPRLAQAVRVLEQLAGRPAGAAPVMLAELAAAATGDTKALNPGTILSTLVLRALALKSGTGRPESAEERRQLWDSNDVVVDDLASRVLVLNLPAEGDGLGEWLVGAASYGTPLYVTLHQLITLPVRACDLVVHVCENPAVLRRAAGDLGPAARPLLCTEGRPSTAFHQLARAVTGGGGELWYHGDFDWPGIAIAASVMRRHGARPWRMNAADYRAGVRVDADHVPLAGEPQPVPWDLELGVVMAATGRVVYEESVADTLIADLAS
jgi:uncharacterized protein (TIGR02679 family)